MFLVLNNNYTQHIIIDNIFRKKNKNVLEYLKIVKIYLFLHIYNFISVSHNEQIFFFLNYFI